MKELRGFKIIDTQTGEEPTQEVIESIALASGNLIYCDIEGFMVNEDGNLILADECGNYAYVDRARFKPILLED